MFFASLEHLLISVARAFLQPHWHRLKASPLGYRLAKGAFWSLAGSVIARGLGLLSGIVVARILGKMAFGQLGMVQATVGMFGVFAGLSLGLTATKHVAEYKMNDPARAGRIIAISSLVTWISGSIVSTTLFLLSPWLATRTLAAPELSGLLQLGCPLLLLGGLNGAQTGALAGLEAFKTIARVSLISGLISFPVTAVGAAFWGLGGAVCGQTIILSINALLNHVALRQEAARAHIPLGYAGCWREWPILWTFSLPSVLGGFLAGPVGWVSSAILVNQESGYSAMGVYSAASRIKAVPELVLATVLAPLLPVLSEQFSQRETAAYNKTLRYAFHLSLVLLVPISLLQIAAPALTMLPYGANYREHSAPVVRWLMVHTAFLGIFFPFASILPSMNRTWFGFSYSVGYSALMLVLASILVPRFGGAGLASALALSYVIASVICVVYICQREKAFIGDLRLIPVILLTALTILICAALGQVFNPIPAAVAGAAITALFTFSAVRHSIVKEPPSGN